jgi:putative SOS response-associated peptidase YedK
MRRCWASSEALPRAPLNRETASVPVEVTTQIYMKAQCRDPCADDRKRDLKPAFRDAFKERRCIVPADGFYEWKKLDAKAKQPYAIVMKDRGVLGFAGLWE